MFASLLDTQKDASVPKIKVASAMLTLKLTLGFKSFATAKSHRVTWFPFLRGLSQSEACVCVCAGGGGVKYTIPVALPALSKDMNLFFSISLRLFLRN